MPTRYVLLTLSIPEEETDIAMGVLNLYPVVGVEMGTDTATISFDQDDWHDEYESEIVDSLRTVGVKAHHVNTTIEEDQNWNAEWESAIEPVIVNERIAIVPEWKVDETDAPLKLIISPKMSFGTGHHSTTRMMCRLVETYVRPGSIWIDVGTGTGVLAILAAKLGAARVYAFDNNEWSFINAKENIGRNGCEQLVVLEQKELQDAVLPACDGIAANLYRHLVIPNAKRFIDSVAKNGIILISGILTYDYDEVVEPFISAGCNIEKKLTESEWCAIAIRTPQ